MDNQEKILNHFVDLSNVETKTLKEIISFAKKIKADEISGINTVYNILRGRQIALVFEKPSTRTRVSFEAAINNLGGRAIVLDSSDTQLGRGEAISDTAKVLSRYVDLIMFRCYQHETLMEMVNNATVPVINGLTDYSHPCQLMADIMTFEETKGSIEDKKVAWIGDCNNMANTWIQATEKFGFELAIACPEELSPPEVSSDKVTVYRDPIEAVKDADLVTTDTWVSMGDPDPEAKTKLLEGYQVNETVMEAAKEDAIFMHCLPAQRGQEVSAGVMDGPNSVVWDEAENRLHIQKSIILWCMDMIEAGRLVESEPFKGLKVLIVEDNHSEANMARKIFDSIGCEVTIAYDGEDAIKKVSESEFNIVFMDTLMPGMNGFDATANIRQSGNQIPIVMITNQSNDTEKVKGKEVGVNDFIVKPLGPKRISDTMTKWCSNTK